MHQLRAKRGKPEKRRCEGRRPFRKAASVSETNYRTIFNTVNDAIFVHDLSGKIVDVNRKMLEIYRCTREEAIGLSIVPDFTAPDNTMGDSQPALWQRVMAGEDQFFEWKARRPSDGSLLDVEVALTKLPLPEGEFILASIRDITERKRFERELTNTKTYLNTVFNNIHDAVFIHDVDGKVTDVNDKMLDMYRCTREEAIGRSIIVDYTTPDGRPDLTAVWRKVVSGEDRFLECKGRRPKDGHVFDVEVFMNKLSLPEGEFVLAVVREITERKRVEKELLSTRNYLKTVFNNIHDAVFIHDINGKVIDVNRTMLDRYRCTREEAIGRSIITDYTIPEGRPDLFAAWRAVMAGEDRFLECKGRRPKDGHVFDVEVFMNKLSIPEGDFILASTRDITERKRMEHLVFKEREVFFSVMKNNPHGIALFDDDNRFAYFNPEFTRITGYTLEDVPTSRDWTQMAYPDLEYRKKVIEFWKADRLMEGRGKDVEFRVLCKDGQYKDIEFRATYLGDRNLVVLTDITARKQAEEELRAEKQRFQTLSESSPVGMMVVGADDAPRYVNPKFKEIFGYDIADIPDLQNWVDLAYPDQSFRDEAISQWIALKSTEPGEGRAYTRRVMCKDGAAKHVTFIPVQLGSGEMLLTCEDITGSKEAEDRIRERNLELEVLNDIITSVSSSLHLPEILETLKNVFITKLNIATGGIFFYSEVADRINMEMSWGVSTRMLHDFEAFAVNSYKAGMAAQEDGAAASRSGQLPGGWQNFLSIPLGAKNEIQGMIFLVGTEPDTFNARRMEFFRTLGKQIGVATQNARLFEQVQQSHAQMKALSLKLVEVQEAERRYIARELHDEIGQQLTGLKFALEMNAFRTEGETRADLMNTQSMVNKLVAMVREMSLNLRPSMLDDVGLFLTLPWHFERFTGQMNIRVAFEHMGLEDKRFPLQIETAVYRIIQEALTNVARHAGVQEVTVRLWSDKEVLGVQIEDHGIGFDQEAVLKRGNTNGLNGMRERAALLGGNFTVETRPGLGTRLIAEFPVASLPGVAA
jgi:PAS domain S-box-containing protein